MGQGCHICPRLFRQRVILQLNLFSYPFDSRIFFFKWSLQSLPLNCFKQQFQNKCFLKITSVISSWLLRPQTSTVQAVEVLCDKFDSVRRVFSTTLFFELLWLLRDLSVEAERVITTAVMKAEKRLEIPKR